MREEPVADMDDRQRLLAERSHHDAKAANDTARSTAQATILINGGAATAVLAFISKFDTITRAQLCPYAIAIGVFAIGVLSGALIYRFQTLYLEQWIVIHQGKATEDHQEVIARQRAATRWRRWEIRSFVIGMICFVAGSFLIAYALLASRKAGL
jgi:hypothetical protein